MRSQTPTNSDGPHHRLSDAELTPEQRAAVKAPGPSARLPSIRTTGPRHRSLSTEYRRSKIRNCCESRRGDIRNCFGELNDPGKPALRRPGILSQQSRTSPLIPTSFLC